MARRSPSQEPEAKPARENSSGESATSAHAASSDEADEQGVATGDSQSVRVILEMEPTPDPAEDDPPRQRVTLVVEVEGGEAERHEIGVLGPGCASDHFGAKDAVEAGDALLAIDCYFAGD